MSSYFVNCLTQIESSDETSIVRLNIDDRISSGLQDVIADDILMKAFHQGKSSHSYESSTLSQTEFLRLIGAIRDRGWVISSSNSRNTTANTSEKDQIVERKFYLEKKKGIP